MNIGDFYGLAVWQNWGPKKTPETPNPVWVARIIARIVRDRARADHLAVEVFPKSARPLAQDLAHAGGRW